MLESEAEQTVKLLGWSREVEDEYLKLCTTLAPELPYPVPSRPVAERKVVEGHVKAQARVLCTMRALAVAAGGKHAELPEGGESGTRPWAEAQVRWPSPLVSASHDLEHASTGRKLLAEYEAIQSRLGVAGGPAELESKVVDLARSQGAGGATAGDAGPVYQSEHMKSALEGEVEELKAALARARRENAKLKKAGGAK